MATNDFTTIIINRAGLSYAQIAVTADSSVALAEHSTGANDWYAILVDGRYYDLVMVKHTIGRPELVDAFNAALSEVESAVKALQPVAPEVPAPLPTKDVRRNRETRDFDAYLIHADGTDQYLGSRNTKPEAEELCDQTVYDLLMTRPVVEPIEAEAPSLDDDVEHLLSAAQKVVNSFQQRDGRFDVSLAALQELSDAVRVFNAYNENWSFAQRWQKLQIWCGEEVPA